MTYQVEGGEHRDNPGILVVPNRHELPTSGMKGFASKSGAYGPEARQIKGRKPD